MFLSRLAEQRADAMTAAPSLAGYTASLVEATSGCLEGGRQLGGLGGRHFDLATTQAECNGMGSTHGGFLAIISEQVCSNFPAVCLHLVFQIDSCAAVPQTARLTDTRRPSSLSHISVAYLSAHRRGPLRVTVHGNTQPDLPSDQAAAVDLTVSDPRSGRHHCRVAMKFS